ncbi:MAG: WYL domain-containing protein [Prolixibacteraceae bacterium]
MSINSSALVRFQKYDECLSFFQREYTKEDILNELRKMESLERKTSRNGQSRLGIEINDRQFYKDLKTIEEVWDIKIDRIKSSKGKKIYRYRRDNFSIFANLPVKNNLLKLRDTLFILQQFKGLPQFSFLKEFFDQYDEDRSNTEQKIIVQFDENPDLVGLEYFPKLLNAIQLKRVLRITHNASYKDVRTIVLSPYFLKEYNNRWFLLCSDIRYKNISSIALDRIEQLEYAEEEEYVETEVVFVNDYFEDVIGVTVYNKEVPINVVLKFSEERFPYVASKPLHGSQKIEEENRIVKIKVILNNELVSLILSYGNDVEVLEPESLRKEIKEKIMNMHAKYGN